MRYLCSCSYDGLQYYGSAKQPQKRTICGSLEEEISKILNKKTTITACSRTDKGVHANIFYFHFDTDKKIDTNKFKNSLNKLTPEDINIHTLEEVKEDFHARYNVKTKEYKYIINEGKYSVTKRNYELEYNKPIKLKQIKKAAKYLIGKHNFKSFTSDDEKENYIRTIKYIKIEKKDEIINIYICADGFLKYMVRNIIGLFLEINEGKKKIEDIPKILESENRTTLGIKAKPNGLYLNKVNY